MTPTMALACILSVVSAGMIICLKKPIYSLVSLLVSVIFACGVLLSLSIEFIAYLYIIVYVGAISILFIFALLTVSQKKLKDEVISKRKLILQILVFVFVSIQLSRKNWEFMKLVAEEQVNSTRFNSNEKICLVKDDVYPFSLMFTEYFIFTFLIALILLISMVGAIILCLRKRPN